MRSENEINEMRSENEINEKINEIYHYMASGNINPVIGIIWTDALSWVLGEDYLDNLKESAYFGDEKNEGMIND